MVSERTTRKTGIFLAKTKTGKKKKHTSQGREETKKKAGQKGANGGAIIADQHLAQLLIITSSPALFHKQPQPWAPAASRRTGIRRPHGPERAGRDETESWGCRASAEAVIKFFPPASLSHYG